IISLSLRLSPSRKNCGTYSPEPLADRPSTDYHTCCVIGMSMDALSRPGEASKSSNKLVAVLQRGLGNQAAVSAASAAAARDELAERLEAKITPEGKIRLLIAELKSEDLGRKSRAVAALNPVLQEVAIPSN